MPLVAAQCTNCGAALQVDNSKDAAVCQYCGSAFIVEKAIHNYEINNTYNIENANIIVNDEKSFAKRMAAAEEYLYQLKEYKAAYEIYNEIESLAPTNYKVWYGKICSQTKDFNADVVADIVVNNRKAYESMKRDFGNAVATAMGEEKVEIRKKICELLEGTKVGVESFISKDINADINDLKAQIESLEQDIKNLHATNDKLSKQAKSLKSKAGTCASGSRFFEVLMKIGLFLGIPVIVFGISFLIGFKNEPTMQIGAVVMIAMGLIPTILYFILYKVLDSKWFKNKQAAENTEKVVRENDGKNGKTRLKITEKEEQIEGLDKKKEIYEGYLRELEDVIQKYQ